MFESKKTKGFGKIDCAYALAKATTTKTVILFHGYGADCWDLFGLKDYLDPGQKYNWYFPNGVQAAAGLPMGRAWFPIDMAALEQAMREGDFRDMSGHWPSEFNQLIPQIQASFKEMGLQPENTIIGGFSQGAMLSLEYSLATKDTYKGLISFSNALLNKDNLPLRAMEKKGMPFIQSHGVNDVILPHYGAETLFMLLKKSGWEGNFHSFHGGHEIPLDILKETKKFIDQLLN